MKWMKLKGLKKRGIVEICNFKASQSDKLSQDITTRCQLNSIFCIYECRFSKVYIFLIPINVFGQYVARVKTDALWSSFDQ